jgi:predicted dehydrogenase/threonine dehydrogenase-like Zn-dependent dehydrogenase
MRQVIQDQGEGTVTVLDVPSPVLQRAGVLVALHASVISSGTERSKIEMGEKSLLGKARARPELAKKVIDQARREGVRNTAALVRDRLSTPQPLGYSAAGTVLEVGQDASGLRPGMHVAVAGAGYANHAEVVYVPATLCAPVPENVSSASAAFATLGSIALHGIRQAQLSAGELVVVSGLGLIGQLTVRLLLAYGHPVIGVDPSSAARKEVAALGVATYGPTDAALGSAGADAVLLTAATQSSDPIAAAPTWCRDRGRVVIVGDVGLAVPRAPYYDAEVDLRFSRSYGPGRYDPEYEEKGHDYPIGYVRWTEGRNLAEFLRLIAAGRLEVEDLITKRYQLEQAPAAYQKLSDKGRVRALLLEYPEQPTIGTVRLKPAAVTKGSRERLRVGMCGAGNFARKTLIPALSATGVVDWASLATSSGLTARHVGEQKGFTTAVGTAEEVITDPDADAVIIATRHDTHGRLALLAAQEKKFAYVEKPLAITWEQLHDLQAADGAERLVTGFNRRRAPATRSLKEALSGRRSALSLDIRVNAGRLPAGHWAREPEQGGRLIGELCHFIDLACDLAGAPISTVSAVAAPTGSPRAVESAQILLSFSDGSSGVITYVADGGPALPKERVEAHWDGTSAIIDDFRGLEMLGTKRQVQKGKGQDKGHRALVAAFIDFARGRADSPVPFHQAAHTSAATLAVLDAIATGEPQRLAPVDW